MRDEARRNPHRAPLAFCPRRRGWLFGSAATLVVTACRRSVPPGLNGDVARVVRRLDTGDARERLELPDAFVEQQRALLASARTKVAADPDDLDAGIWVGRRLGYLGRYFEAIDHYTAMLERFPDEPRLLRHRGHRSITVRQLQAAIDDLENAAELVSGREDRVEADGLPNARNQPTSTLKTNVYYHLGLAYFLTRRFDEAIASYRRCLRFSANPDMEAATRQWLFAALVRAEQWEEAAWVLQPVRADWDIIENDAYHRLLLVARGEHPIDAGAGTADAPSDAAWRFGVAHFLMHVGSAEALRAGVPDATRRDEGIAMMRRLADDPGWASFGVIAAEAELATLR